MSDRCTNYSTNRGELSFNQSTAYCTRHGYHNWCNSFSATGMNTASTPNIPGKLVQCIGFQKHQHAQNTAARLIERNVKCGGVSAGFSLIVR